jgi:hypothetical protein
MVVPAGQYTLFTIPGPDSWTLIINSATGITGTAYDQANDFARVTIPVRAMDEEVEPFTILVEDTPAGGVLLFRWDRTEAYAEFVVR